MARESKQSGFQSAAGLIRYYDNEEDKLKIPPWFVVGAIVVTIFAVEVAKIFYKV
jgi:preprotein translocase subunit Sec61beta